jgi:riboflavin kinase/FMN adenylyltransferase
MSKDESLFSGVVVKGIQKGSEIGFPTINIQMFYAPKNVEFGIYVCKIDVKGLLYNAIMHYGNKSVGADDNAKVFCEVHVFDFNQNVYGLEVSVNLLKKIRDVRQFKSDKDLIKQIKKDIVIANKYFKKNA